MAYHKECMSRLFKYVSKEKNPAPVRVIHTISYYFGKTKIYQSNVTTSINHHILRLQISIDNPMSMKESKHGCNLCSKKLRRRYWEAYMSS